MWTVPVRVCNEEGCGITGADVGGVPGAAASLQAAARAKPALKRVGKNREWRMFLSPVGGFVIAALRSTSRHENADRPWPGSCLERSPTVFFS